MNYYRLYESRDLKVVGSFPQVLDAESEIDIWSPSYIGNMHLQETGGNAYVPIGLLDKKAKITDLLSCVPHGLTMKLLVSPRLAELIKGSNYCGLEFYTTAVKKKGNSDVTPYELIHPTNVNEMAIDFTKSEVVVKEAGPNQGAKIDVINYQDFLKKQKSIEYPKIMSIEKLELNNTGYDFFLLQGVANGSWGWYVSEALKAVIEQQGCTGLVFKDINMSNY